MFAYDYSRNKPYVADAAGWVNILTARFASVMMLIY